MAIYPRISESERNKIPEKDRCPVSYNGYHTFEIARETPASTPILICTKCQLIVSIKFPEGSIDKVKKES